MNYETQQNQSSNGHLPREVAARMIPVIRRMALRLARRLPSHVCVDDLVSAGLVGLVTAHRRFDEARGDDFDAYAETCIRGAMIDELRAQDPLSRDLRAHAKAASRAQQTFESKVGRAPTELEMAAAMGLDLAPYRRYTQKAAVGPAVSLDAGAGAEDAPIQVADAETLPADERLFEAERRASLATALEALPPRLRQVVELYYGEERKLRDIGAMLGVTESRVCQLQTEAVARMRAHCQRQGNTRRQVAMAA